MSIVFSPAQITPYNSTTYVDLLGILVGLRRLTGESAATFMERIRTAAAADRGVNYIGVLNELSIDLNLPLTQAIHIEDDTGSFTANVSIAGLTISNVNLTTTIPLVNFTPDGFWKWSMLSALVSAINATGHFTAGLLSSDGPSLTLARQTNHLLVAGESIGGQTVKLQQAAFIQGSESFSNLVPSYTVAPDGQTLCFSAPVPDGTAITYRFRQCPYDVVAASVGLFSLTDPAQSSLTLSSAGCEYLLQIVQAVWMRSVTPGPGASGDVGEEISFGQLFSESIY